ncbi:protein-disulfide reductase DsbD N-terminal domain-containing protein [Granulicella sp. L60]|uniref:protein-disulfide reductase DsbD N-terminal domain-containing protein n=1 Tax=Granulicella sp. L60 TaxID=1641866 RepID=UPI00131DEC5F|nr:protein-disulfide reductase DsbD N-terminal domain-containing protein [Granulicella sp. L60]
MTTVTTRRIGLAVLLSCLTYIAALAQGAIQPVSWALSSTPEPSTAAGSHLTLDLTAHIDDGWHVYAFHQAENGPTPLRITADPNGTVQLAGTPSGTSPIKRHDTSFDLDTEIFDHQFTVHVPVLMKLSAAAGEQIGLDVRFQACNDHICLPPKTVHLTVPLKAAADIR